MRMPNIDKVLKEIDNSPGMTVSTDGYYEAGALARPAVRRAFVLAEVDGAELVKVEWEETKLSWSRSVLRYRMSGTARDVGRVLRAMLARLPEQES